MSHVQVDSSTVIRICEGVIAKILQERETKWKEYVTKQDKWYYRVLSKIAGLSLEDFLEETWNGRYVKNLHFSALSDCHNLITLAKLGTPVTVTTEDAYIFKDYQNAKRTPTTT